jgi:hypothetical protein
MQRRGGERAGSAVASEVYLDSVAATNKFISELLQPNVARRFGQLRPGEYDVRDADGSSKNWFDYCSILMGRGSERRSPVDYMISATKVEPFHFDPNGPISWRQFTEMINMHPDADLCDEQEEEDAYMFIDPESHPSDHELQFFTAKQFRFRYGQRLRNSTRFGFIVNGVELTFEETSPDEERPRIRKEMDEDQRYMTAKEWELGSALSSDEMEILLEAMESLGLYRVRRQRSVVLPQF